MTVIEPLSIRVLRTCYALGMWHVVETDSRGTDLHIWDFETKAEAGAFAVAENLAQTGDDPNYFGLYDADFQWIEEY